MKILIVSDPWPPVVSGLVRTFQTTITHLERMGHQVEVIAPDRFFSVRCPTDTHLRLSVLAGRKTYRLIEEFQPDAIHLAAEGPLGWAARRWCIRNKFPFTTSYTTKLPEYLEARTGIPARFAYGLVRWFHGPSAAVMVSTDTLAAELAQHRVGNLVRWSRGVDVNLFRPGDKSFLAGPRPILLYVGRVAIEKNIEAFLNLEQAGTKYVVGDGPQFHQLKRRYPQVRFVGNIYGEELSSYYAAADAFVFPSKTDTFGLVMLEALASGVPVAAFPVPGPLDVVGGSDVAVLDDDLATAVRGALQIDPVRCRQYAQRFSWSSVAELFVKNLRPAFEPLPVVAPQRKAA